MCCTRCGYRRVVQGTHSPGAQEQDGLAEMGIETATYDPSAWRKWSLMTHPGLSLTVSPPHQEPWDSQNIADDPDAPHVCGVADGLIVDHFRSHKLWGPKEDLQRPSIL